MGCTLTRECVSKKKRRMISKDYNLDLVVIHEHIIAMGFPSIGVESMYRNPYRDVVRFLDKCYGNEYMVYNLCSEKGHFYTSSDRVGGEALFYGRVVNFPFPDHHACLLEDIPLFIEHAKDYINSVPDENRIVCIHCKAGKGRTGLFICALLLEIQSGTFQTPESVIRYYGKMRTKDGKGLTLPCQIRYVQYYNELRMKYNGRLPSPDLIPVYNLRSIEISGGLMQFLCKADCIRVHLGAHWKSSEDLDLNETKGDLETEGYEPQKYRCIEIPVSKSMCEASEKAMVVALDKSTRSETLDRKIDCIYIFNAVAIPQLASIRGDVRIDFSFWDKPTKWLASLTFHTLFLKPFYHYSEIDKMYKNGGEKGVSENAGFRFVYEQV